MPCDCYANMVNYMGYFCQLTVFMTLGWTKMTGNTITVPTLSSGASIFFKFDLLKPPEHG